MAHNPDSVARIRPLTRSEQVELSVLGATFTGRSEWHAVVLGPEQGNWDTWVLACRDGALFAVLSVADEA